MWGESVIDRFLPLVYTHAHITLGWCVLHLVVVVAYEISASLFFSS
jgi:hypothetical protein